MLLRRVFSTITLALVALIIGTPRATLAAPNAGVQENIKAAITKTAAVTTYRYEMDYTITGAIADTINRASDSAGLIKELSLLNASAAIKGKDSHVTFKGVMVEMMGLEAARGLETINVGDKTYVRGPLGSDAPEDRWYDLSQPEPDASVYDQDIGGLVHIDLSSLRPAGTETLDGRRCDVYNTSHKSAMFRIIGTLNNYMPPAESFDELQKADLKFWICDDGYLHQIRMDVEGTSDVAPENKFGFKILHHRFDFNGAITIAAPTNAAPLDNSGVGNLFTIASPSSKSVSAPSAPASGALTATVGNGGNIRRLPNLQGEVLGQLHAYQVVTLYEKNLNGTWYLVEAPEAIGWVNVTLLRIDPAIAGQVRVAGQSTLATQPSTVLTATVAHGGNRRAAPSVQAKVLGLVEVGETVQLLSKTRDGVWYEVRCRCGAMGWVHSSLLKIEPAVARQVPMA